MSCPRSSFYPRMVLDEGNGQVDAACQGLKALVTPGVPPVAAPALANAETDLWEDELGDIILEDDGQGIPLL